MILELGPGADILRALGALYWVLGFAAVALVLWLVKKWLIKIPLALLVAWLFVSPAFQSAERIDARKEAYMAKRRPAEALFREKCKVAEAQHAKEITPIENVEGIQLLKVRPASSIKDWDDQFWPGAALPMESSEDSYVLKFLLDNELKETVVGNSPARLYRTWQILNEIGGAGKRGFQYVELLDPETARFHRITARLSNPIRKDARIEFNKFELEREVIKKPESRYAVTFEDNVDPEIRRHWVAGTTVKVIDTKSGEIIAEQEYWAMDAGFGSTNQRMPWKTNPMRCPEQASVYHWATHMFVERILKTKQDK